MDPEQLRRPIKLVIEMLAGQKYAELEFLSAGTRLKAEDIKGGVENYGGTIILPPEAALNEIDAVQLKDAVPEQPNVRVPRWTAEGVRSDLFLELITNKYYKIGINDFLVF